MENNGKRSHEYAFYDGDWVAKQANTINARIRRTSLSPRASVGHLNRTGNNEEPRSPNVRQRVNLTPKAKTPAQAPKGKNSCENTSIEQKQTGTLDSEEDFTDCFVKVLDNLKKIESTTTLSAHFLSNLMNVAPEKKSFESFHKNRPKNRNTDVFCLEQTRVKLEDPSKDYIHANLLTFDQLSNKSYIVTQHPLAATIIDFWRMCMENRVETIVSLTNTKTADFPPYFPTKAETYLNVGDLFVYCRRVIPAKFKYEGTRYQFDLIDPKCVIVVWLYHYPHWQKNMVPGNTNVVLNTVSILKRQITTRVAPVVVQCETGVNQSAELVLVDVMCNLMTSGVETSFDAVFRQMRKQRISMMTNRVQFLHAIFCFLEYSKKRYKLPRTILDDTELLISKISKNFAGNVSDEVGNI